VFQFESSGMRDALREVRPTEFADLVALVAQERGGEIGGEVGYQVRFENCVSDQTRIRYVTEGVLLRQFLSDPQLQAVSGIIPSKTMCLLVVII
jgi:DNA polymerase III alpha subunit